MVLGLHLSPLWTSPQMVLGVARYSGVGVTPRHHTTHTPKPPPNFETQRQNHHLLFPTLHNRQQLLQPHFPLTDP